MESKVLQPEIWAKMIAFLHRPPPPPFWASSWSELHQHDLTVIARVNLTLHELATRLLYRSITVEDLPLLLRDCFDEDASPSVHRTKTKAELLKTTKELHIAHMKPESFGSYTYGTLGRYLLAENRWAVVDETPAQQRARYFAEYRAEMESLEASLPPLESDIVVFPSLERVVLGTAQDINWYHLEDGHPGSPDNLVLAQCRDQFSRFLLRNRPKHICVQTPYGPFVPYHPSPPYDYDSDVIINTHYQLEWRSPTLIAGATYRLYPAGGVASVNQPFQLHLAYIQIREALDSLELPRFYSPGLYERTRYEIYGLAWSAAVGEDLIPYPTAPDHAHKADDGEDHLSSDDEVIRISNWYKSRVVEEQSAINSLESLLNVASWPSDWSKRSLLGRKEQTPQCTGCGWDLDQEV